MNGKRTRCFGSTLGESATNEGDGSPETRGAHTLTPLRRLSFGPGCVQSLRWDGATLIDDVSGGRTLDLDGVVTDRKVNWAFSFDRAVASPSGRFVALYQELGTKAIVTRERRVVRELDRSFYCADVYEYPICLFALRDGREVVAHCPNDYNRLEIDDLETGERLTVRDSHDAADVFHSRLRSAPDGRHLLSAGWVWHPYGVLDSFDVEEAIANPASLDEHRPFTHDAINAEVESACWLNDDLIAIATSAEEPLDEDSPHEIGPDELGVWSISESQWRCRSKQPSPRLGSMVAFHDRILGLFEHPKLIDPFTGELLAEWPEIASGRQEGSIVRHLDPRPPAFAGDQLHNRFAVADHEDVIVVDLPPPGG